MKVRNPYSSTNLTDLVFNCSGGNMTPFTFAGLWGGPNPPFGLLRLNSLEVLDYGRMERDIAGLASFTSPDNGFIGLEVHSLPC